MSEEYDDTGFVLHGKRQGPVVTPNDFDEAMALLKEVDAAYRRDAFFDAGKPRLYPCLCGAGRDSDHFPDCRLAAFLKKWGK